LLPLDPLRIPQHVAIIMDGNGRWAKRRGLPREAGHAAGEESLRVAVETAAKLGVKYLTVYAFSTENWKRPPTEIKALMELLKKAVQHWLNEMVKNDIRIRILGRITELPQDIQEVIRQAEKTSQNCKKLMLNIMLNYGGRAELVDAVKDIVCDVEVKKISVSEIDEELVDKYLYTAGIPDPDLLIRTSGELRISNYMIWQMAYTEFYFTDVLWPDFREKHFIGAVQAYQKRQRRKGDIG
jgi:undecaprenyl diphosphate synthase